MLFLLLRCDCRCERVFQRERRVLGDVQQQQRELRVQLQHRLCAGRRWEVVCRWVAALPLRQPARCAGLAGAYVLAWRRRCERVCERERRVLADVQQQQRELRVQLQRRLFAGRGWEILQR